MTTAQDLLAYLQAGEIDQFNDERDAFPKLDFFGADLSGIDLSGANLADVNLRKSDLSNSDLSGAILTNSFFNGADLCETILEGVEAENSQWCRTFIENSSFQYSNLHKANFNGAELRNVDFSSADLSETQFKKSTQANVQYNQNNLEQAKFSQSQMEQCQFQDVQLKDSKFPLAELNNIRFATSDLHNCNLALTIIRNCEFLHVEAERINFDQAKLHAVQFTDSNISEGNFLTKESTECQFVNVIDRGVLRSSSTDPAELLRKSPPFPQYLFHQARQMASGHEKLCITWENFEGEDILICYAVYCPNKKSAPVMGTLPIHSKLLRSRNLIACPDGFLSICLEKRNGSNILAIHTITPTGQVISAKHEHLDYLPISNLCITATGSGALLYGLANQAPKVRVNFMGYNGQHKSFGFSAPNVQKMIGKQSPIATRISGSMFEITHKGLRKDILGSHGFPGTKVSAESRAGTLAYAWIEPTTTKLWGCINGQSPRLLSQDSTIRSVQIGFSTTNSWAIILVINSDFSNFLVASSIEENKEILLTGSTGLRDILVEEFHCLSTRAGLFVYLSDQDGRFYVFSIKSDHAELLIESEL